MDLQRIKDYACRIHRLTTGAVKTAQTGSVRVEFDARNSGCRGGHRLRRPRFDACRQRPMRTSSCAGTANLVPAFWARRLGLLPNCSSARDRPASSEDIQTSQCEVFFCRAPAQRLGRCTAGPSGLDVGQQTGEYAEGGKPGADLVNLLDAAQVRQPSEQRCAEATDTERKSEEQA
jgi:hypothetical protein